jgi:hypothetical protein
LVEGVKGEVGQAGVLEVADAILGAGALTVPDFQTRIDQPRVLLAKQVIEMVPQSHYASGSVVGDTRRRSDGGVGMAKLPAIRRRRAPGSRCI